MINLIYKVLWFFWLILVLFFRETSFEKTIILIYVIPLIIIAVCRAINAREDWRPIAEKYHKDIEE